MSRDGGLLPPLVGVTKRVAGGRGETRVGPVTVGRFRVVRRGDAVDLVYRVPLRGLVDRVRTEGAGWRGEARLLGRPLGRFRMTPRAPCKT